MTRLALALCLLATLLLAAPAPAHGPLAHTPELPATTDEALAQPLDGFDTFLHKFGPVASQLVDAEGLRDLDTIVRHWSTYQQLAPSTDQEDQLTAARHCSQAQSMMLHLLEHARAVTRLEIKDGNLSMESPGLQTMPGSGGHVLLSVANGEGPPSFRWMARDVGAIPEPVRTIDFPGPGQGLRWMLLELREVPELPALLSVQVQPAGWAGQPLPPAVIRVQGRALGQLLLRVLDEHGNPTPAMVRIESREGGGLVRPSSAIEFAPQMDDIGGEPNPTPFLPERAAGQPYPVWLPADLGGPYWCTAGPSDMGIAAGEYEVRARRGFEYVPATASFTITPGQRTEVTLQPDRWIDMPARGWWSGDDHVHSRLMSSADADRLIAWMEACDLHVANILMMGNPLRTYFEQRGYGREFRVVRGNRALVPGQEDPRAFNGHSIGLNIDRPARDTSRYMDNAWVSDEVRRGGGLYGHAHMLRNGFLVDRDLTMLMPQGKSDFGEVLQSNILDVALYYEFLNLGFPLAASAGSDVPFSHAMGEVRVYCFLGEGAPFDVDAWFDAMRRGRTFVTNGPMLELSVDDALPGDTIALVDDKPLRVTARVLGPSGAGAPSMLRIVSQGDILQEVTNDMPSRSELSIELDVPAGFGRWIAAEAASLDGTRAHTTPVYVTRQGFRFWDVEKAPALIANRRATLDGMEAELRRFLSWGEGGVSDLNPYLQMAVAEAPAMLARIDAVRALYDDLEATLVSETEQRGGR